MIVFYFRLTTDWKLLETLRNKLGGQIKLMKAIIWGRSFHRDFIRISTHALIVAGFLFGVGRSMAQMPPSGGGSGSTYTPLDSWSFHDHTNWTSDNGFAPVSFTNLAHSYLGNGASLVVDSTNAAWLKYQVVETNNATNLTVKIGTVTFWFASSWSSTNQGGTGPGEWGRLFEVGNYTTNSSCGWWSLYVDPEGANLYFSAQTNDSSGNYTNYLSVPIAWTTNYFHFVALTYSATNTALYLDGVLATNGPPVTVYPGPTALTNGFFIGSDSSGVYQAKGLFNKVATYNVPLDAYTIQQSFTWGYLLYMMSPWNTAMFKITSASSAPSFGATYSAISGAGNLQWNGTASGCVNGTNALHVWATNITATAAGSGTMDVTFTIAGGQDGYVYDVFATGYLQAPLTNAIWAWLGQGYHCNTYTVNLPSASAFLLLGTPLDADGDGLTSAYESLVSHTDPDQAQSDAYGVPYAWYLQNGLSVSSALLDPDQDGLLNYQEYQYGTRPQVSEGFAVWVSQPGITSNLP